MSKVQMNPTRPSQTYFSSLGYPNPQLKGTQRGGLSPRQFGPGSVVKDVGAQAQTKSPETAPELTPDTESNSTELDSTHDHPALN